MKVLILTNPAHIDFVAAYTIEEMNIGDEVLYKYTGEYDWSDDYDIGISFMYQHKVPAEQVNTHPWFNFHPAPLPEYKGRNLCYHAIINGEKEFGATVHYMDENFDTGDIIDVRKFPIYDHYTAEDLSRMALSFSEALFMLYFPLIIKNTVFSRIPNQGGMYYKKSVIMDTLDLSHDHPVSRFIRAVTYKNFVPRFIVGGLIYKIVRDE